MEQLAYYPEEITPKKSDQGTQFSVDAWVRRYHCLAALYGAQNADKIWLKVAEEDIGWISWEASKSPLPKKSFYKPFKDGRLVHISDLQTGTDILEGVTGYRDGLEIEATANLKKAIFQTLEKGETDSTLLMISTKFDPKTERAGRCVYDISMVNKYKFIEDGTPEGLVELSQYQREGLDRRGSARLFNHVGESEVFNPETVSVDRLITHVLKTKKELAVDCMLESLGQMTGEVIDRETMHKFTSLDKQIKDRSKFQARKLLEAVKRGEIGWKLEQTFNKILIRTVGLENLQTKTSSSGEVFVMTSCGGIGLFGPTKRLSILIGAEKGIKCQQESCGEVNYSCGRDIKTCYKCKSPLPQKQNYEYLVT